jgi:formate-dependent nitrite reductase membrane component NrfD
MRKAPRQTARQWIVTHEWMVNPMQQTEWIEKQGLLIWLAEVFSSLGTGLYLVSIFYSNWWGALLGWLIIMLLKLPLHLVYLGKPTRFWRALPPFTKAWRTSWIARGFFFTTLYSVLGFIQLISSYYADGSPVDIAIKILAGFFCVLTAIYCGFMMSYCKSVPFWNTGLLPVVIMIAGIADGFALLIGVDMWTNHGEGAATYEAITRILLLVNILLIGSLVLNSSYRSETAGLSAREMMYGRALIPFWAGVVVLGIFVPLLLSLVTIGKHGTETHALMIAAIICHTIGAFSLKYAILKVGIYEPILPKAKVPRRMN